MRALGTRLEGPVLIEPVVHRDGRGFFCETGRRSELAALGVHDEFVQDNQSRSAAGVLRGMHFTGGQAKLVRCARGAILDVVTDVRRSSVTFGQWEAVRLDDERLLQLYVPAGFAHGFYVLSEVADVVYSLSTYYDPESERGFAYDDPDVGIEWPSDSPSVSARDSGAPRLAELGEDDLPD